LIQTQTADSQVSINSPYYLTIFVYRSSSKNAKRFWSRETSRVCILFRIFRLICQGTEAKCLDDLKANGYLSM